MERATATVDAPTPTEAKAPLPGAAALPQHVLALQRAAGNRATRRALAHRAGVARVPLDAVPAAQRTQLREVTDQLATIDVTTIHSPPGATGARVSGTVTPAPVYGAAIAATLHPVLMSVLGHLLGGALPQNSTSAVLLDLTPYGGSGRVYRFTHVVSGDPPQPSYFIEEVGAEAAAPQAPTDATAAFPRGRFDAHSFTAPAGDREFEAVIRAAVQMVPDAILTMIDGVGFLRGTTDPHDAATGGRYAESQRAQDHHLRETYAETFAMFITEPQTLRAMRPSVYAYFAGLAAPRRGSR